MKKSFKKIVSAVLAASMTLTSVMVVNVAPVTAAEAFSGKATINAETVKTLFPSGLTDGNELGSGVSIVNGGSAFTYKANNLKFTDGSAYSTEFQIGNGNEKLSQTLKAGDDLGGTVEKGLKIEAAKAGTIKIYAGLSSSGVMEAPICLVDAATSKVVDAQSLINTGDSKSKVYNIPTFTVPAAGTYYLVQNGKVSGINLAVVELDLNGGSSETTTETTTVAPTTTTVTTTTTETTTETTTVAPTTTTETTTEVSTEAVTAKVVVDKATVKVGDTVNANVALVGNKGFNNYTAFVEFDPTVVEPVDAIEGTITKEVAGVPYTASDAAALKGQFANVPAAGNTDFTGADGVKTQAQLGKIKYAYVVPAQMVDGTALQEFDTDGNLFGISFKAVKAGDANIKVTFVGNQLSTVSSAAIAKTTTVETVDATVKVEEAPAPTPVDGFKGQATIDANALSNTGLTSLKDGDSLLDDGGKNYVQIKLAAGKTPFSFKTNVTNFTDGQSFDATVKKFQVGKGNELIPADLTVGSEVTADVEKGISMKLGGSGTITIHAGLGSTDAMTAPVYLINATTKKVVSISSVVRDANTANLFTVCTLDVPEAGEYVVVQPGNISSLNICTIDLNIAGGSNPDDDTTTTTTETTTETTTTTTTETTTETTTVGADGGLGFLADKTVKAGDTEVTLDFGAKGINTAMSAFTGFIVYDASKVEMVSAEGNNTGIVNMINEQIAYAPSASNPDYPGANGTLTTAQLGKMKIAYIYSDGSAISSIGTPDATLASVKFTLKNVNAGDVIPVQFVSTETDGSVAYTVDGKLATVGLNANIIVEGGSSESTSETTTVSTSESTTETTTISTSESTSETTTTTTTEASSETTTKRTSGGGGGGGGGASVKKTTTTTEATTEETTSKVVEGSTEETTNKIVIGDNGEVKIVTPDGTEVKVNIPKDVVNSDVNFSDLGNYGWAKDYINKLAELGIVTGTEDGIYSPELGCKRGDFAILINRTLGLDVTPTKNFSDNEEGKYYYNDVRMGYTAGILSGYGDNTYKPEKYCNRDEMFVLVAKTLEYLGVDVTSTPTSVNNKYSDVADVAWWSAPYLAFLTQEGIVTGNASGNVEPKKDINRAEMAVMMYKDYEFVRDYVDGLVKDAATTTTEETTEETTVDESASTTETTTDAETTTETTTVAE